MKLKLDGREIRRLKPVLVLTICLNVAKHGLIDMQVLLKGTFP